VFTQWKTNGTFANRRFRRTSLRGANDFGESVHSGALVGRNKYGSAPVTLRVLLMSLATGSELRKEFVPHLREGVLLREALLELVQSDKPVESA
jgi:hypothetical protein